LGGFREPSTDPLLAFRHRFDDRSVEEMLEQPDEDQKVHDLRADREPIDLHG
jgi:hypothetical protein